MSYTKTGPFTDGVYPPALSAAFFNGLENALVGALAGAPIIAAEAKGVIAGGSDVSGALTTLLAGITAFTVVKLPAGTVNLGSTSFNVDASLVAFVGDRTTLTGTGTFNLFSSATYSTRQGNWGAAFRGVIFKGPSLTIGHATYTTTGMLQLLDGGMIGGALTFISNAWKIAFRLFHLQGTTVSCASSASNTGENMVFDACMIADGSTITLANSGDWHFIGCSMDNQSTTVSIGDFFWHGGHFESANATGYRMLTVGATGSARLLGTQLLIDQESGPFNMAPFTVDPGNLYGGLIFENVAFPLGSWIQPATTDLVNVLVAGGGRVRATNSSVWNGQTSTPFVIAECFTAVGNSTFESGTVNNWTVTGTGSCTADGTVHNRGSFSMKLQAASGQTETAYQEFPVAPQQVILGQVWRQVSAVGASGSASMQIDVYDKGGTKLTTTAISYEQLTAVTVAGFHSFLGVVPRGGATGRITFIATGGTGTTTANYDDVLINVI